MKRSFTDTSPSAFFKAKRQKQEDYASKMFEQTKEKIDNNFLEGIALEKFDNILKRLILKWTGKNCTLPDCEGRRLVNKFIRHKINNPLTIAVVADSQNQFFKILKSSTQNMLPGSIPELVNFACISGAISIISKLLNDEEIMSQCSKSLIAYAVSSGNRELSLMVANFFLKQGMKDPGLIYLYSFGKILLTQEISNLFENNVKNHTFS
jgi:hypothetical protein